MTRIRPVVRVGSLMLLVVAALAVGCCGSPIVGPSAGGGASLAELPAGVLLAPDEERFTREEALKFAQHARGPLAPVYPLLAKQIVEEYGLAERAGIGIDLGAGPGTLIVELCRRTKRMHWINADINPHHFALFYEAAAKAEVAHRVSAVFADAQALPFRDNYADVIVSRGTFQFWKYQPLAFAEIYRVLKPGGVAFIGRGLPDAMPAGQAREIRAKHGAGPQYDVARTVAELHRIMRELKIEDYRVRVHHPEGGEDVNYGVWLEFRKPRAQPLSR